MTNFELLLFLLTMHELKSNFEIYPLVQDSNDWDFSQSYISPLRKIDQQSSFFHFEDYVNLRVSNLLSRHCL